MDHPSSRLLSPSQRNIVATAVTFAAVLAIAAFTVLVFVALSRVIVSFSGVIWPLVTAGILALVLRPAVLLFDQRLKLGRTKSIALLYALFLLVIVAVVAFFTPIVVGQILDAIEYTPRLVKTINLFLQNRFPDLVESARATFGSDKVDALESRLIEGARQLMSKALPTLMQLLHGLTNMVQFGVQLAIIPVYLFFLLCSNRDLTRDVSEQLLFLKPAQRDDIVFLIGEFVGIIVAFFRGQILIGLIMGGLLATGFALVGLKFSLILGLLLGLLNIVPYLGSIIGLTVTLPLAYFQDGGGWSLVFLCVLVFTLAQMTEGYFLTPRIMGHQTGLHPMVIIAAVFFWGTALDGILGMLLAVPLTAFLIVAWRLAKRKYLPDRRELPAGPHARPAPTAASASEASAAPDGGPTPPALGA